MNDHTFGSLVMVNNLNPYLLLTLAVVSAFFGMFMHWFKKQYKDGMHIGWFNYFFVVNKKATLQTVAAVLTGLFGAFAPIDYTNINAYQVIVQAFAIGYGVDSAFNNAEPSNSATPSDTPPKV